MLSRRRPSSRTVNLWLVVFLPAVVIQAPSNAAVKVRVRDTSPTPTHRVLGVADTSNLFKKTHLDLEIVYMPGNISLPSLLSGEIQVAQMTGALMSPARLQGGDPVMLASVSRLSGRSNRGASQYQIHRGAQGQTYRHLPLRRRLSHARAQFAAEIRPRRKRCHLLADWRYARPRCRAGWRIHRRFELFASRPFSGCQSRDEDSLQHARAECRISRDRASHDAAPNRKKPRCSKTYGKSLPGINPSRQDEPESFETGICEVPKDY